MRLAAVVACALGVSFGLGFGPSSTPAANATPLPIPDLAVEPPMQIHLVRSAVPGCEPDCPEWIAAQGRIEEASLARFKRVLRQLKNRKVPVLIDSGGGRVNEALAIGRLARAKGLDVVVSRTLLLACAPADAACQRGQKAERVQLGLPAADLAKCASSCAFILAAGTRRLVGPTAFVGVHQVRSFYIYAKVQRTYQVTPTGRQLVTERRVTHRVVETRTPQRTYDQIGRYFAEMGIGAGLMPLILATPGDRLYWLSPEELQATGLVTDWIDAGQMLAGAAAGPVPALGPVPGPEEGAAAGVEDGGDGVPEAPVTASAASPN